MSKYGFRLIRLSLTGLGLKEATVDFSDGLNVIYGPSDTGKTFIVKCIDFIFGGKMPMKSIPEARGYEKISVVISPWEIPKEFRLTRSLKGGPVTLHTEGSEPLTISEKHNPTNKNCVSRFLLSLTGLDEKRVRKNSNGETDSLSFRDLAKLVIINEENVIGQGSPYLSGQYTTKTKDRSVFHLLLTGVDDSSISATENSRISKARKETKIEVMRQLLYERCKELDELGLQLNESAIRLAIDGVLRQLEGLNAELLIEQDSINTLEIRRKSLWEEYKRSQSHLVILSELGNRFDLLSNQYRSDLSRLEAISEAGFRLAQMPEESCPICGALPEHHRYDHLKDSPPEDLAISCEKEAIKIRSLIDDLSETRGRNDFQIAAETEYTQGIHAELILIDKTIKNELQPRFRDLATRIRELTGKQPFYLRALYLYECVRGFRNQLNEFEMEKIKKPEKEAFDNLSTLELDEFCQEVEGILREWVFPDLGRVTFSEYDDDIIISGQKRASHGKGVRAITHTAFNLGLLRFCKKRSSPHPGFLVVDSPLVVYSQPDDPDFDPKDKGFSTDVKEAFYKSLSKSKDLQVVICENDHPPAGLDANVIHFTKTNEGRYGFIPMVEMDSRE